MRADVRTQLDTVQLVQRSGVRLVRGGALRHETLVHERLELRARAHADDVLPNRTGVAS